MSLPQTEARPSGFPTKPRLVMTNAGVPHAHPCATALRRHAAAGNHSPHGREIPILPALLGPADCLLMTSVLEGSLDVIQQALACNLLAKPR